MSAKVFCLWFWAYNAFDDAKVLEGIYSTKEKAKNAKYYFKNNAEYKNEGTFSITSEKVD